MGFTAGASARAEINTGYFNNPMGLQIDAGVAGPFGPTASASASVSADLLITGGAGTGYLDVVFMYSDGGDILPSQAVRINGVTLPMQYGMLQWGVIPFTFGEPFSYDLNLSTVVREYDSTLAEIQFAGARVYASEPSGCGPAYGNYGLCNDPDFTDASSILGEIPRTAAVPEPGTALLLAGALGILLVRLRFREGRS